MKDIVWISLTFPRALWEKVRRLVPPGERSRVIPQATGREIRLRQRMESVERIRLLQQELRAKYGQLPDSADEIRRMRAERGA